jgi:hypothetical protein
MQVIILKPRGGNSPFRYGPKKEERVYQPVADETGMHTIECDHPEDLKHMASAPDTFMLTDALEPTVESATEKTEETEEQTEAEKAAQPGKVLSLKKKNG